MPATPIAPTVADLVGSDHAGALSGAARLAADVNAAAEALENIKRLLVPALVARQAPTVSSTTTPAAVAGRKPPRGGICFFLAGFALSAAVGGLLYIFLAG